MKVRHFDSRESLNAALADRLKQAIEKDGGAIMLSGGHSPRPAYQALSSQSLCPAPGLRMLYSDERYVPSTSPDSNYRASLPLLSTLALPEEQVFRVRTELPLDEAASDYEQRLRLLLHVPVRLGLLGMGADGHTASLFTPEDLERARGRLAIAVQRPDGMQAVSVTPDWLSRVEKVLMVVIGAEKREKLAAFIAQDPKLVAWRAVAGCEEVEVWSDI